MPVDREKLRERLTAKERVAVNGKYGSIVFDVTLVPSDDVVEKVVDALSGLEARAKELASRVAAIEEIARGLTVGRVRLQCTQGSCSLDVDCLGGDCEAVKNLAAVEAGVLPSLAAEVYSLDPLDALKGVDDIQSTVTQLAYKLSLFQQLVNHMLERFGRPGDPGEPSKGVYTVFEVDDKLVERYNNIVSSGFWAVRLKEANGAVVAETENLVGDDGASPLATAAAASITRITDELVKLNKILGSGKRSLVDELLLLIWYDRLASSDERLQLIESLAEKGRLLLDEELAKKLGVDHVLGLYKSVYGFRPAVIIEDAGGAEYLLERLKPSLEQLKKIISNPPADECTGSKAVGLLAEIGKKLGGQVNIAKLYQKAAKMGIGLKHLVMLNALLSLVDSIDAIRESISAALGRNSSCSPCAERALFASIAEPAVYRCNGSHASSIKLDVKSAAEKAYSLIELVAKYTGVKPGVSREEFLRDLSRARLGEGESLERAAEVVNRVLERAVSTLDDGCNRRLCDNIAESRLPYVDKSGAVDDRLRLSVYTLRERLGDRVDWSRYDKLVSRCAELCGWSRSGGSVQNAMSMGCARGNGVR